MVTITLHTAKTTYPIRPRSPRHRASLVREAAQRDGWAYATERTAPGVRIVVETVNESTTRVGQLHMDLDFWTEAENAFGTENR